MKNRGGTYVLIAEKNSIRTLTAAYSAIKVLIENDFDT